MPIPPTLDAFESPRLLIEPELTIKKPSYSVVIVANVIDKASGASIQRKEFEDYEAYMNWAPGRLLAP